MKIGRPLTFSALISLGVFCVVGMPVSSHASAGEGTHSDESEPDPGDAERAQKHFDKGAELYSNQEYGRAIVEFRRGQEAHPHPLFLYNIALASLEIDDHEQVLEAAREIETMEADLPPENSARNRSMITSIETMYRSRDVADDIAAFKAEKLRDVDEPSAFGPLGWAGMAGLGLGAASLAGAGLLEMRVRSSWDEVEDELTRMSDERFEDEINAIEWRQSTGRIMLFAGAGLFVVGGALVGTDVFGGGDQKGDEIVVRPSVRGLNVTFWW